ncbi:MAG: hypothetical protein ACJ79H_06880 [Myxococcales bacterium]
MKLVRVARNVILAGLAWRYIARRRALARQRRRSRRLMAPALLAGGAGMIWMARRRIAAGAQPTLEVATPAVEQPGGKGSSEESHSGLQKPGQAEPPTRRRGKAATNAMRVASATGYREPPPTPKKRRRRVRQQHAQEREKAEQQSAHGGKVNVEIDETPELRAPLGDLKH